MDHNPSAPATARRGAGTRDEGGAVAAAAAAALTTPATIGSSGGSRLPTASDDGKEVWMGAFERMMGDHQSDVGSSSSNGGSTSGAKQQQRISGGSSNNNNNSGGASNTSSSGNHLSASKTTLAPRSPDVGSSATGGNAWLASRSGHTSPLRNLVEDRHTLSQRQRARSGSVGATLEDGAKATNTNAAGVAEASGGLAKAITVLPPPSGTARPAYPRSMSTGLSRNAQTTTGPSLVAITPSTGPIVIDGLYVNHAPGVHVVHIANLAKDRRMLLRMTSTLGRALTFSKLKRAQNDVKKPITYPTNTVRWARQHGLHPGRLRDLRHLVSNLEPSDSLILESGQEMDVYLTFRPTDVETKSARLTPPRSPTSTSDKQSLFGTSATSTNTASASDGDDGSSSNLAPMASDLGTSVRSAPEALAGSDAQTQQQQQYHLNEVGGTVCIRASVLSTLDGFNDDLTASSDFHLASNISSNLSSSSSSRPPSFHGSYRSSATSAPTTMDSVEGVDDDDGDDVQVTKIAFYASSCRPHLSVTRHRHHAKHHHHHHHHHHPQHHHQQNTANAALTLDFGDIFVGQREELDVYMHNHSEIDLYWQARLDDADNMLGTLPITMLADETVLPTVTSHDDVPFKPVLLTEFASRRIRIVVEPREACRNFEQVITLTNLHNASNSYRVVVRANMLAEARDEALSVLTGSALDFGDCAGGHWTRQLLVLRNTCEQLLDVHFSVEAGIEADFQLAELAQRGEEDDKVLQEVPPPMLEVPGTPTLSQLASSQGAASAAASGSSESSEIRGLRDTHLSSDNLLQLNDATSAAAAGESARTPTSYAQLPSKHEEPPFLALTEQQPVHNRQSGCKVTPRRTTNGSDDDEEDDVDASSVASQAGSMAGSPARGKHVQLSDDVVLEPASDKPPPPMSSSTVLAAAAVSAARDTYSDVGSVGGSDGERRLRSRPSSVLFSSRPSSSRGGPFGTARTHDGFMDDAESTRSDLTAVSHDSRIGPFLSSASHAGSASSSSVPMRVAGHAGGSPAADRQQRAIRHGGAAALKGMRGQEQTHGSQIEELVLRPGAEYRVIVSHRPARGEWDEAYSHGRLQDRTFRLMLDYTRLHSSSAAGKQSGGRERKTITCRTRTCTSFISIAPKVIDFGLANVGARKSAHFAVHNHSELTARVDLRFVSKVLSMYRDEIAVPPGQSIELRVDFFPRRVNESYRKQVTVANLLNRANDEILEVRSSNVDEQRISFHSLFYRILTSTGSNFIDFGDVNINCTRLRSFGIENVSNARLGLELSAANPEDLKLYVKVDRKKASRSASTSGAGEGVGSTDAVIVPAVPLVSDAKVNGTGGGEGRDDKVDDPPPPPPPTTTTTGTGNKTSGKAKRTAHLKERFLETMSQDVSASARNENNSWRAAQKQSHFTAATAAVAAGGSAINASRASTAAGSTAPLAGSTAKTGVSSGGHAAAGEKAEKREGATKKPQVNLVAALKKGGKGRLTQRYGKSITFKDRLLLSEVEYLDLASGPPVDGKRISAKSKRYQTLDANETGRTAVTSKKKAAAAAAAAAAVAAASAVSTSNSATNDVASAMQGDTKASAPDATEISAPTPASTKSGGSAPPADAPLLKARQTPALTGRRKAARMLHDAIDVSKMSLDDLVTAVEAQSSSLSTFFLGNPRAEEQSVRTEVNLQRELRNAIQDGRLAPVDVLALEPGEERQVLAVYSPIGSTRPHIQGNARKQDSRIFIRLTDFDVAALSGGGASGGAAIEADFAALLQMDRESLPVRDLMVKSNLCRSLLELSQPHINFGHVQKGETKTRKIVIQNRSEWALRYCIRKSGSIASGDIKLKTTDRYGVVPGHGKREVEFVFCPSLTGVFQERLTVENVADRDRDEVVLIKANVTRLSNFSVEPAAILFGGGSGGAEELSAVPVGGVTKTVQWFVVSNLSSKARSFVVHIDDDELRHGAFHVEVVLSASVQEDGMKASLTKAEEEEVEHISQKLKIASRKGHADKVRKYHDRLTELGVPVSTMIGGASENGDDAAAAAAAKLTEEPEPMQPSSSLLTRVSNSVTIALAAQQSKRFMVRLRPLCVAAPPVTTHHDHHFHTRPFDVRIPVQIHEAKNIDEVHVVEIRARIQSAAAEQANEHAPTAVELPAKEEGLLIFSSQREDTSSATTTTTRTAMQEAQ